MRALLAPSYLETGNFSRLYVASVPVPSLHSSTVVLVKVAASSVNPVDYKLLEFPILPLKFPARLGMDMAGTVSAIGGACPHLKVGDAVWADMADDGLGGYAEYALIECSHLGLAPPSLTPLEAASLPLVAMTGRAALFAAGAPWAPSSRDGTANRLPLSSTSRRSGPVVMVLGGSGGCGAAGIQLALAWGASTVYTTTSKTNFAFVANLGAARAFDYHTEEWTTLLGNNSVDVVYDTVGVAGAAEEAMGALRPGGTFVTIAGNLAAHPKPGVRQFYIHHWEKNVTALDDIAAAVRKGALRATLSATVGLAAVPSAFGVSAEGHVLGKIAVDVTT